ncbi:hypothetical protein EGW08_007777, partial [Elysia chlorotica]
VYNPSYAHLNGYTTTSLSDGGCGDGCLVVAPHTNTGCPQHHAHQLAPCYEEVVGELSQVLDCSMVDSEMVTEYCQHNLQVNQEKPRYSTGSEDSARMLPTLPPQPPPGLDPDNLSTVSMASSSVAHGSTQALPSSGSCPSEHHTPGEGEGEPLYEEVKVWPHNLEEADLDLEHPDGFDPSLNLRQYIIPSSKQNATGVHPRSTNQQLGSPDLSDIHFYPGMSQPIMMTNGNDPRFSHPISFSHPLASVNFKPVRSNGVTGLPVESDTPDQLVVTCTGPTGAANCRSRCDPEPNAEMSTSDC